MKEGIYMAECTSRCNGKTVWTSRIVFAENITKATELADKYFRQTFDNTPVNVINVVCYVPISESLFTPTPNP